MLKAIAIDDEPIALEIIKSLAEQISFISIEACFTNAFEAISYLQKNTVDVMFLDIKMPNLSGIDLLKAIAQPPMVIFTTAYSEHAVQSFELNAIDYLLKPFSLARFIAAFNKAYEQYDLRTKAQLVISTSSSIFIKSGYEQMQVELGDILYAESVGNYMRFVLTHQTIVSRLTMTEVEKLLPSSAFIRIHRSFILAKKKITKTDKRSVWIQQKEFSVGAAYTHEIEKWVNSR